MKYLLTILLVCGSIIFMRMVFIAGKIYERTSWKIANNICAPLNLKGNEYFKCLSMVSMEQD